MNLLVSLTCLVSSAECPFSRRGDGMYLATGFVALLATLRGEERANAYKMRTAFRLLLQYLRFRSGRLNAKPEFGCQCCLGRQRDRGFVLKGLHIESDITRRRIRRTAISLIGRESR